MTHKNVRPPRLAEHLMQRVLKSDALRHGLIGDLREEYARRMERNARAICNLWFWSQAIVVYLRFRSEGLGGPAGSPNPFRWLCHLGHIGQDVKIGLRSLRRRPLFVFVVTLTLGIGVGATTAIFNVIDGVFLRRLPYQSPSELVNVWLTNPEWRGHPLFGPFWDRLPPSADELLPLLREGSALTGVVVHGLTSMTLNGAGDPEQVRVGIASADLFRVLGVKPTLGRSFLFEEDGASAQRLVLLSDHLWASRLGADPAVLGRTILLDDEPFTVIGVLPTGFRLRSLVVGGAGDSGERALWIPAGLPSVEPGRTEVIARLKGDVSIEAAQAEAQRLLQAREDPRGMGVRLAPRKSDQRDGYRAGLLMLFGASSMLLLIACSNIATLMMSRALERTRELATRAALGAGIWRLAGQLLTESVLIGLMGSAVGFLVALGAGRLLLAFAPPIPGLENVGSNGAFLLFAVGVGLFASILFGLIPSLVAVRRSDRTILRESPYHVTARGRGVQRWLVTGQVALTVMLLVGSGLLVRSVGRLFAVDKGLNAHRVTIMEIALSNKRYESDPEAVAFFREALERIREIPAVVDAGGTSSLPLGTGFEVATPFYRLEIAGLERSENDPPIEARGTVILPGFHEALQIPLLAGRTLSVADHEEATRVMVVNESMARRIWPTSSPLGREVTFDGTQWRIVGVVSDVKDAGLELDVQPLFYVPHAQAPLHNMALVVRASSDTPDIIAMVREVVWSIDSNVPISSSGTMASVISLSVRDHSYRAVLFTAFAIAATLVAAAGVFGVTAQAVESRSRELGIRIALGITPSGLAVSIVWRSVAIGMTGTFCGLIAAFWVCRVLSGFLYGVETWDPVTYGLVAVLTFGVCLTAGYIPTRRVSLMDPVEVLKVE
jgi:predicted permease